MRFLRMLALTILMISVLIDCSIAATVLPADDAAYPATLSDNAQKQEVTKKKTKNKTGIRSKYLLVPMTAIVLGAGAYYKYHCPNTSITPTSKQPGQPQSSNIDPSVIPPSQISSEITQELKALQEFAKSLEEAPRTDNKLTFEHQRYLEERVTFIASQDFLQIITWFRRCFPQNTRVGKFFWNLPSPEDVKQKKIDLDNKSPDNKKDICCHLWTDVHAVDILEFMHHEFNIHKYIESYDKLPHEKPHRLHDLWKYSFNRLLHDDRTPHSDVWAFKYSGLNSLFFSNQFWTTTFGSIGQREAEYSDCAVYYHGLCSTFGIAFDLFWRLLNKRGYKLKEYNCPIRAPDDELFHNDFTIEHILKSARDVDNKCKNAGCQFDYTYVDKYYANVAISAGPDFLLPYGWNLNSRVYFPFSYFVGSYWLQDGHSGFETYLKSMCKALKFDNDCYFKIENGIKKIASKYELKFRKSGSMLQIFIPNSIAEKYVCAGGPEMATHKYNDPDVMQVRILAHPNIFLNSASGVKVYRYESDPDIKNYESSQEYSDELDKIVNDL